MINEVEVDRRIHDWFDALEESDCNNAYGEFFERMTYRDAVVVLGGSSAVPVDNGIRVDGFSDRLQFLVFTIEGHTFLMESFYDSWSGTTWDDAEIYPVVKKEKTVTVWERA